MDELVERLRHHLEQIENLIEDHGLHLVLDSTEIDRLVDVDFSSIKLETEDGDILDI